MGGFGEHANPDYAGRGGTTLDYAEYFIPCSNPDCDEKHCIKPGMSWRTGETRICAKCGASTIYDLKKVITKFPYTRSSVMETVTPSGTKNSKYPGYELLEGILMEALAQAAGGKGKDRHAANPTGKGIPFIEQKIVTLGKLIGPEGPVYQACKKATEGLTLRNKDNGKERCRAELLGAIVYLAGAIHVLDES